MTDLDRLRVQIRRHCPSGRHASAVSGLTLVRNETTTLPVGITYRPLLCVVAQGAKRVVIGSRTLHYGEGTYLVVSHDLPVSSRIIEASPERPYLAAAFSLDPARLALLIRETGLTASAGAAQSSFAVSPIRPEILDPFCRMLALLDDPAAIAVMAPLIEREILFQLLRSEAGDMLRQIAFADSHASRVSRAIAWISANYAHPFSIDAVAEAAHMSPSSLHRHFKAVTMMSPLQYQKALRLQEARNRLIAAQENAANIGSAVGYDSPSQFTREYARMFGAPPGRDAERLRQEMSDSPARYTRTA